MTETHTTLDREENALAEAPSHAPGERTHVCESLTLYVSVKREAREIAIDSVVDASARKAYRDSSRWSIAHRTTKLAAALSRCLVARRLQRIDSEPVTRRQERSEGHQLLLEADSE